MSDLTRHPLPNSPFEFVKDGHGRVWAYCTHCGGHKLFYDALVRAVRYDTILGRLRVLGLTPWVLNGFYGFVGAHFGCLQAWQSRQ